MFEARKLKSKDKYWNIFNETNKPKKKKKKSHTYNNLQENLPSLRSVHVKIWHAYCIKKVSCLIKNSPEKRHTAIGNYI